MNSPRNLAWTSQSIASKLTYIEVIFQLSPRFFPDARNLIADNSVVLPMLPSARRKSGEYTSAEALSQIDELITHYRSVLELISRHQPRYMNYFHHFWLRLRLRSESAEIEFAGYDTWAQMRALFSWLERAETGSSLQETINRWEILIARLEETFHFKETGVGLSTREINLAFPRGEILARLGPVRARVDQIITHLVDEFGQDYWTEYRQDLT